LSWPSGGDVHECTQPTELCAILYIYCFAIFADTLGPLKTKLMLNPLPPFVLLLKLSVCIIGDQLHCDQAKEAGLEFRSIDDLKKFNKNKKQIKVFAKQFDAFLASESLIKVIPRVLGPALNKVGKFPTVINHVDNLVAKVEEVRATIKFQLKKVLCLGVAIGHVDMTSDQLLQNIVLSINFLVSLLKKNWQNVRSLYIKSSMGKPFRIY